MDNQWQTTLSRKGEETNSNAHCNCGKSNRGNVIDILEGVAAALIIVLALMLIIMVFALQGHVIVVK